MPFISPSCYHILSAQKVLLLKPQQLVIFFLSTSVIELLSDLLHPIPRRGKNYSSMYANRFSGHISFMSLLYGGPSDGPVS